MLCHFIKVENIAAFMLHYRLTIITLLRQCSEITSELANNDVCRWYGAGSHSKNDCRWVYCISAPFTSLGCYTGKYQGHNTSQSKENIRFGFAAVKNL